MSFFEKIGAWVREALFPLGSLGLFGAAALDSSVVSIPAGVDLWLMSLCAVYPSRMLSFVLAATAGSLLGYSLVYLLVRTGKEKLLKRRSKVGDLPRARGWLERYGVLALAAAALLPPPSPYKPLVVAAALLKFPLEKFLLGLLLGRFLRYLAEGLLAARYGRQAWEWIVRSGPWAIAGFAVVLLALLLARRLRRQPG